MMLSDYQFIYYNEYIHRMLGRWTGMLYVVPLFYFMWRKTIPWRKSSFYLIIGLGSAFVCGAVVEKLAGSAGDGALFPLLVCVCGADDGAYFVLPGPHCRGSRIPPDDLEPYL
jgi:hypothetical protein